MRSQLSGKFKLSCIVPYLGGEKKNLERRWVRNMIDRDRIFGAALTGPVEVEGAAVFVNDLQQDLDLVGITFSLSFYQTSTVNTRGWLEAQLSTNNGYDVDKALVTAVSYINGSGLTPANIFSTIGNFNDPIYTLHKFPGAIGRDLNTTAERGALYLNYHHEVTLAGATNHRATTFINLWFKR